MEHIKTSPRDFFLQVLSNLFLYYCAGWLVSLLYDYINFAFGSTGGYYYGGSAWFSGSMRWAIASLVIVFPVYVLVTRFINRDLAKHPEKKDLRIRKWMMYLTLALASLALIIDVIALLYQFLSGEFALTFFLKVLAVAVVSGLVWGYYYYELRRDAGKHAPSRMIFRYISIALVAITIIGGFFIVGSPTTARQRQYDMQRVSDLQTIQWQLVNYWQSKQMLPASLDQLNDPISGYMVPVDPEGAAYGYKKTGNTSFEVCATFSLQATDSTGMVKPITGAGNETWVHGAGQTCFTRMIDMDLYPPRPATK